ncbi:unnamed protein product [Meganyctiphanes norvegica]|uniref:Uncharacterized protein n=2 Tax=Meganyctiphanes norvegica TaxID=48144 RepID=A0AAV2SW72_MEGNR
MSSTGESSTTGSIPRTFSPFVVTNTTPSFNFGSTVNPFDTSLLDTTTAVSSMSLLPSVSATSVAITPVLAAETRSTIGSSTQLASSVTNVKGNSIVYITQTVSDTTNSITPFSFLTNSAKASVSNISQTTVTSATKTTANINFNKSTVPTSRTDLVNDIASSAAPLLSSFETSTVSSPFSLGNLSHPSKNGISNTQESVADAAKQITAASFSFVNSSSASVRPKVNFACGLTKAFTSFPNISTDYLSQSESSLCSTNIERKNTIAEQKDLPKKVFSFCSSDLTNFSGFRFLNSNTSVKSCANNVPFAATAFTNDTTTTTSNTDVSASAPKSVPLFSPPSFFLPIKDFEVRDIGTMTSDNSSTSPVTFPVEAVTTAVSTCTVISPFFDISNNVTSFSSFAKTKNLATMTSSMASESVRPKSFCTSSSQIKVSNSDSKCTAIIAEDKSGQKIITKDGKFSSESSCDDKSTNTVPSFKFTMNPGMFSGISFPPSTSMATPNNSNTATMSADLSPACSANSTTAPTTSLIEPISFRLVKPKTYNFS